VTSSGGRPSPDHWGGAGLPTAGRPRPDRRGRGCPHSGLPVQWVPTKDSGRLDSRGQRHPALPLPTEGWAFPTQIPVGRVPLLAVWQGGPIGRGVPRLGRTRTRPIGHTQSVVPSRDVLGLPRHPASGPSSSRGQSPRGLQPKRRGFDAA